MKTIADDHSDGFTPAGRHHGSGSLRRGLRTASALAAWLTEAMREASRRRRLRRAMRAQRHMLAELDERTLKDIGLHRSEIDSATAEHFGQASITRRRIADGSVSPLY
ncbi:MAG: DUF1127 domain-containing protein [Rhodocyclaceae bacterium]